MFPDSNVGSALRSGLAVLRYMGPRWAAFRAWHGLKIRSGWFERRWPVRTWDERPLKDALIDPTLAKPDQCLNYRRTTAPFFFFRPADREALGPLLTQFDWPEKNPVIEAERIASGEFSMFSHSRVRCGLLPDWDCNPLTGQGAPAEAHWSRIGRFTHG